MPAQHLYLHVPYCQAKCPYCDFNSIAGREDEFDSYVDALLQEVGRLPPGPYATIYLGGGTPTVLAPTLLQKLLTGIRRHIQLTDNYEWTCEANPGSADAERFVILAEHGVNRLSVGVQSTHEHHLRWLGRVHTAKEADQTLEAALRFFPRVSADLIFGLPGQTETEIMADLGLYARHGLQHASVYHLMIEPGTVFAARKQAELDPEQSERAFALVRQTLREQDLPPYETSNYAATGQESRHNLAYWNGHDYQGAGAGAVSCIASWRSSREKHPGRYIQAITSGGDAIVEREQITPTIRLVECWMLGLRHEQGVDTRQLRSLGDHPERWRQTAQFLIDDGFLLEHGPFLRLSDRGRPLQDYITTRLMP
jgi:putative oxygen-independent coproporphyrinogen III oxidase